MPQTVFLGGKEPRSTPSDISRRGTPAPAGTPPLSRLSSIGPPSKDGTAVVDLRRKLAQMEDSTASLTATSMPRGLGARRDSLTSVTSTVQSPTPTEASSSHAIPSPFDLMPGSPSESVMSAGMDALRRKHTRTAPALVGSVHTNISGVLEAPKIYNTDEEVATSGRTSPMSMAGTIRVPRRVSSRAASVHPVTTYGKP